MLDFTYDPPDRNPEKPLRWILIDSLIIALIVFISALPPDRPPTLTELYIALRGFFYALIVQLAAERGIKPYMRRSRREERSDKDEDFNSYP